ncbi:MAG TPA: hypothetical protein VJB06_02815 [archaeon]|nr:hypothetical protein [archaeon]
MEIETWSIKKWREEIDTLAVEMWLGDKLARTVGMLTIDTFDEDQRPVKLATAALTLKFLKYKAKAEVNS